MKNAVMQISLGCFVFSNYKDEKVSRFSFSLLTTTINSAQFNYKKHLSQMKPDPYNYTSIKCQRKI